jgi:hypothetical protein
MAFAAGDIYESGGGGGGGFTPTPENLFSAFVQMLARKGSISLSPDASTFTVTIGNDNDDVPTLAKNNLAGRLVDVISSDPVALRSLVEQMADYAQNNPIIETGEIKGFMIDWGRTVRMGQGLTLTNTVEDGEQVVTLSAISVPGESVVSLIVKISGWTPNSIPVSDIRANLQKADGVVSTRSNWSATDVEGEYQVVFNQIEASTQYYLYFTAENTSENDGGTTSINTDTSEVISRAGINFTVETAAWTREALLKAYTDMTATYTAASAPVETVLVTTGEMGQPVSNLVSVGNTLYWIGLGGVLYKWTSDGGIQVAADKLANGDPFVKEYVVGQNMQPPFIGYDYEMKRFVIVEGDTGSIWVYSEDLKTRVDVSNYQGYYGEAGTFKIFGRLLIVYNKVLRLNYEGGVARPVTPIYNGNGNQEMLGNTAIPLANGAPEAPDGVRVLGIASRDGHLIRLDMDTGAELFRSEQAFDGINGADQSMIVALSWNLPATAAQQVENLYDSRQPSGQTKLRIFNWFNNPGTGLFGDYWENLDGDLRVIPVTSNLLITMNKESGGGTLWNLAPGATAEKLLDIQNFTNTGRKFASCRCVGGNLFCLRATGTIVKINMLPLISTIVKDNMQVGDLSWY